jgi:hypothetical protein
MRSTVGRRTRDHVESWRVHRAASNATGRTFFHFGWLRRRLKSELRYRWGVDMKPRRGSAKLVQLRLVRRLASLTWLMLPVLSAVARALVRPGLQAALQSASAGAPARVRWCVAGGVFAPRVARGGRRVRAHLRRHPRQRLRRPDSGCNCRIGDQSADQAFPISGQRPRQRSLARCERESRRNLPFASKYINRPAWR